MTPIVIGLLAFALAELYLDMDVAEPVQQRVATWLAHQGWGHVEVNGAPALAPRKRRGLFRFAWKLQDCPYCISTWVAFFATWYALDIHPWHRAFWITWWAAVGTAWVAVAFKKQAQATIDIETHMEGNNADD